MIFPTFEFAAFFLIVFIGFWYVFRRPVDRRIFLTAAGYAFYAFWDWRFCFLLLASTAVSWVFGLLIGRQKEYLWRKILLVSFVVINLAILGFFKYWDALSQSINSLLVLRRGSAEGGFLLPIVKVALPVGLSFYTFKAMSYVFDVFMCKIPASAKPLDVALYVSFFPQISSGPIMHAAAFIPQIEGVCGLGIEPGSRPIDFSRASYLIGSGLFKKLILANFLSTLLVDPVFADLSAHHTLEVLLAAVGYSAVIYADFSGYSDMAIGFALLLGFDTTENFRRPYTAFSVTDFWKRWHITFSSWLREYLYFSFGGSRFGKARTLFALVATMILGGLWHGPRLTFVIWGVMQGVALAIERAFSAGERRSPVRWKSSLQVCSTFAFVTVSWIVFRAASPRDVLAFFVSLANFDAPIATLAPLHGFLLALAFASHAIPPSLSARAYDAWAWLPFPAKGLLSGAFIALLSALSMSGVAPFIYFQF